jgi:hypothetical protein
MDSKNFNFTTSVSTPIEYYKILILQRLNDLNEAWESYSKIKHLGQEVDLNIIHARTESLFNALYPYLERKLPPESFAEMETNLFEHEQATEKELRTILNTIARQLDIDRITKMDTRNFYDGTRAETENQEFGL